MIGDMKIYVLHYRCGSSDERVTCNQNACDLCSNHNKTFYEEKEVNKDELYDLLNGSKNGNYIHISVVKPEGWKSEKEYFGFK